MTPEAAKHGSYWIHIDLGSDHRIKRCPESPGGEWIGPYSTWTAAKRAIVAAGVNHAEETQQHTNQWRRYTKAEWEADQS